MIQTSTLKFLKELKKHNEKNWFDSHRAGYEAARNDFGEFVQQLINRQGARDKHIAGLKAKECIFRINRDIRFSKDKSPYKTNFGASMNRGGKKSIFGGYYFQLEPGKSFVGGGMWMPMPPDLKKVRQEIEYCLDEFRKIVEGKKFKSLFGELYTGESSILTKVPQGFEKDSPAAPYLKYRSFVALHEIPDSEVLSPNLVKKAADAFATLQPLVEFMNRAVADE